MSRTCGSSTFLQDTFQKMLLPIVVNWRQPSRHWFRVEISTEKPPIGLKEMGKKVKRMNNEMHICLFIKCINGAWPKLHERSSGIKFGHKWSEYRVHTLFWTKNSRSFQGDISHFFKDSVQCKKEPWVCLFWFFLFYPEGLPVFAPFRHLRMVCANPGNEAFSLTRPTVRARERPWKTLVTWLQNKINSEGAVLCLTFFCLVYSQRSRRAGRREPWERGCPGNSQNNSLNLVCPRFKRETEGGRTFSVWAAGLWKTIPISFERIECVHSFKKTLIDFYASS